MKISYNWLKQYISISETPEELGKILTSTGLEVESIEIYESVKGGLKELIIGEVLTCDKHPNADKLFITTVDIGDGDPSQIICGAPNVAAGQKVVVATPGTTIFPTTGDPFTIKKAKIKGEESAGMICAQDEIGLGDNHDGIIVLDTQLPNGTALTKLYPVEHDHVFEIGLTPNRADAASHIGVARDIKAFKDSTIKWPDVAAFKTDNTTLNIPVAIENKEACPRYSAVTISGVTVAESPHWLKNRIETIGLTPINNIVDITNFVCHELGQPLHAFDANKIAGGKVIVKTMPAGSKFITLDEKERILTSDDLMICNEKEGMCIAGVFGGVKSGITNQTQNLFLESAYFSAHYIRKTGMHHQLKTDASFRFERGTDPAITVYALKRAALLIKEIAGGNISSELVDEYPNKVEEKSIEVKYKNIKRLIGKEIPKDRIQAILKSLDIDISNDSSDKFIATVPTYRVDVVQEADIIEEILRIYGFDNIELSQNAGTSYLAEFPAKDKDNYKHTVGEMLVANGFYEILTNSLTNEAYLKKSAHILKGQPVEILNKLSEEQGVMRQSMLFTGLEVCVHNINRRQRDLKFFEFGKIYWKDEAGYQEEERLALYMSGNLEPENWQTKPRKVTYYDLAQQVTNILKKSNVGIQQSPLEDPLFDYGMTLTADKKIFGKIGKVKSAIAKDFGLKQEIFYADLNAVLLFNAANPKLVIEDVPKFPEVRRDLSLVLDRQVTFSEIKDLVLATEKKLIKELIAFDVYEGKNIPEGKKAYALGFILLNATKTLTDEEIDNTMNKLMSAFEKKMGALIRK
ncbi:MAG TPA: phenylalanine--tRNA ligase subunit beta [Cyclobacteriaceae bacterium]